MKKVSVIQHTSAEYLGLIEDHLEGRRIGFRYFRPFTSDGQLPRSDELADAVVLLGGGPWGSAGVRDIPSLAQEIALTRTCLELGKPVVGIGLGSQVLAIAAGGGSEAADTLFEVDQARRTSPAALNGFLPERFPLAVCMRDRPLPPPDASVLALDRYDRPAVFQVGDNSLGFTGHPGIKLGMVEDLVMEYPEMPDQVTDGLGDLRVHQSEIEDALVGIMTGLIQITKLMRPGGSIPFSLRFN